MDIGRRSFIAGAGAVGALAATARAADAASPVLSAISDFAPRYMAAQGAPGMIVGIADAQGLAETARYGVADLASRRPIGPQERFHIGSITKSFTALMILQLAEEGKLKLDADITRYLPGLPLKTPFGPVTVHGLLTHSSGLPSDGPAPGWPDQTVTQASAPGARFWYCNLGYEWLGHIVVARGGEPWSRALHRRILDPLGMTETSPLIGAAMRQVEVPSFVRREDDRPYPPRGPLTRAATQTFVAASGCIASTAADMNKYIRMLARGGQGPNGRLISPEGFTRMTSRQVEAEEFGPGAGYGYGWAVDRIDGNRVIRHTGGMESFMSSMHVDLDAGFGAFASINAQQNYRPVPVTKYALALHRAFASRAAAPKSPSTDPDEGLELADYVGDYRHADGRAMKVVAGPKTLSLLVGGRSFALQQIGDDAFVCTAPAYRLFTFLFTRKVPPSEAAEGTPTPVVALSWARDTYLRPGAALPAPEADALSLTAQQLRDYEGLYVADGGWSRAVRAVVRDGRLWLDSFDGISPLSPIAPHRFRFAGEAFPERVSFSPAAESPRVMSAGGRTMVRIGDSLMEVG